MFSQTRTTGARLNAGEIDRFVETAVVHGAIAEEGDADVIATTHARADPGADRVADAGGNDAIGAEQADRAVVEMHGAAATAATTVPLAEKLGHQNLRVHALGERMPMAAMGRRDPVGGAQVGADADGRRFLADIEMEETGGLALPAGRLGQLFKPAQQHHRLIE